MEESKDSEQEGNAEAEQEEKNGETGDVLVVEEVSPSGIPFIQFMEKDSRGIMLVGVW